MLFLLVRMASSLPYPHVYGSSINTRTFRKHSTASTVCCYCLFPWYYYIHLLIYSHGYKGIASTLLSTCSHGYKGILFVCIILLLSEYFFGQGEVKSYYERGSLCNLVPSPSYFVRREARGALRPYVAKSCLWST